MPGVKCGIVGLPNVGKSTFYNLVAGGFLVPAENYPFCTIEPHSSNILVQDERLTKAAAIAGSKEKIYATITMVDIAGLIEGASKGEGLGNKFLQNIEMCDVILHMVRCYIDDDIIHVKDRIDPLGDIQIIEGELILSDMQKIESRVERLSRKIKTADKALRDEYELLTGLMDWLGNGRKALDFALQSDAQRKLYNEMRLLTAKPVLYVCNVADSDVAQGNAMTQQVIAKYGTENVLLVAAKFESDLMTLEDNEERMAFLEAIGVKESGLSRIIGKCYHNLGVHSFFTIGPKEARAWTINQGSTAFDAAGEIHTDFQKGFIRAEVISYKDFVQYNGEQGCKNAGAARVEGREYIVQDADIMHFRFNV